MKRSKIFLIILNFDLLQSFLFFSTLNVVNKLRIVTSISISAIVLTLTMFVNPSLALAQQNSPAPVSSASSNGDQRCQKVTAKISTMLTNSQARLQKRQAEMATRNSNIQKRIQNLQSKGADTTKLSSDAGQLVTLQNQWVSDFQKYTSLLQATQSFTCGDSQGKFKTAIQAVKDQLKVIKQDNQNIKSFSQQTLQVDFQATRTSVKGKKPNPSGNNTTGTTVNSPAPK